MGAVNVLGQLNAAGVRLSATGEGGIRAEPRSALSDEVRRLIRANKAELLALLADPEFFEERAGILEFDAGLSRPEAEARAFEEWRIRLKNGTDARLIQQPPATLAELRRRFPGVAEAWPEGGERWPGLRRATL